MEYKLIYLAKRAAGVKPEDWPRHWRSHAVFASTIPSIGAVLNSVIYCSRQLAPTLDGVNFDPPEASHDYDGVAVVSSSALESLAGKLSPEDQAKIDQDELRVFSTLTPRFSFYAKEALVHGRAPGGAAVIRFLARKPGTSREAFLSRWSGPHADIALRAADSGSATRYVHDELVREPPPGYPFDGITETWLPDAEAAAGSLVSSAFAPVRRDLAEFCDMDRSVTMLTYVTHRWPKG